MASGIQVYGTDWCRLTFAVREALVQSRVTYDYFNVEHDPRADEFVRTMHDGQRRYPMVVIGERVITNPSLSYLRTILERYSLESGSLVRRSRRAIARARSRSK